MVGIVGVVLCKFIEMLLEMKNLKQLKLDFDIQKFVKLNIDVVVFLGYVYVDLFYCCRELIKLYLNKDYVGLCVLYVLVIVLLFGNDL